jgi:hypothetical protein
VTACLNMGERVALKASLHLLREGASQGGCLLHCKWLLRKRVAAAAWRCLIEACHGMGREPLMLSTWPCGCVYVVVELLAPAKE